ncbi:MULTISPECIES: CS1 type fimbrial major subunit [Pseudomonas]|uniref:Adhesin n=1 Tax=Pseudomonas putida TaxID=303 RepID=A0A6S5EKW2_PSEPU|nr:MULTISPECIES: CS1 type fimbrial major subunit [Pseudomonas]MBH3359896.1 adhesin [Pseudomonas guariconensis]MCO7622362.1 fimbrial protein [Pseudomonas guariconensis]MDD2090832.1 fimbrial protein [Pseudomonas guariconensis]MEB3842245.1 fimbrial protein [Pseudomonas guariconensis]MEB3875113.1 fimbrial protein [Pseudomonas guariconensis]
MKARFLAIPFLALAAGSVTAAETIEKQVQVVAQVPTEKFYVEPVGNWMDDPQALTWNPQREDFSEIRRQFQAKSTIGPVTAFLLNQPEVVSGIDKFGLNVTLAGKALGLTPVPLLTKEQAAAGTTMDFVVSAVKPAGGYKAGSYQGMVNMMFESEAPGGA